MDITDVNTMFGAYPAQRPDSSPEVLAGSLEGNGVAWSLALSTWGVYYSDVEGNRETLRACRAQERLIPVATVNPTGFWGQAGLLEDILAEPFEMFRFFPNRQGWPLNFAPFKEIVARLAAGPKMPIMIGISHPGEITQLGWLLTDFPHPVILEGVSSVTLAEFLVVFGARSNFYLETHALETPGIFPRLRDAMGIERILFGSDAPGLSLAAALETVRTSGLSETQQSAILASNAAAIWQNGETS